MTSKKSTTVQSRHRWLFLSQLTVHPVVQRAFSPAWAKRLVAKFDPDAFGVLKVVEKAGVFLVWDGQHRLSAALEVLGKNQQVQCEVFQYDDIPGHTEDDKNAWLAHHCLNVQAQRGWLPIDNYFTEVVARDETALFIKGVLSKHGLRLGRFQDQGVVCAAAACSAIAKKPGGKETFERIIEILADAWGGDPDAYQHSVLRGCALLCSKNNGRIDDKRLASRLQKAGGPGRLLGRARDFAKATGCTVVMAVASVMTAIYNKGCRTNRLPVWD